MKFKFVTLIWLSGLLVLGLGCKTFTPSATTTTSNSKNIETPSDVLRSMPSPLEASLLIARDYEQAGKLTDSIRVLEAIVAEQGEIPAALHRLGVMYGKTGQPELARHYLERAVKVDPVNSELLTDFGFLNHMANDFQSAEQSYLAALKADPTMKRAHNNFGVLLASTGRTDMAIQHFYWAGNDDDSVRQNLSLATGQTMIALPSETQLQPLPVSIAQAAQVSGIDAQWPQVHHSNPQPSRVQQSNLMKMPQAHPQTEPVQLNLSANPPRIDDLEKPFVNAKKLERKSDPIDSRVNEAAAVVQTAYWDDAEEESCQIFLDASEAESPEDNE